MQLAALIFFVEQQHLGHLQRVDAKRPRPSELVRADWRTSARRSNGATYSDRRDPARRILAPNLGQVCVGLDTGGQPRVLPGCDVWPPMCPRAYGLCGQIGHRKSYI
jgi:hypothetical protein